MPDAPARHFIQQIIDADIASGKWGPPGQRSVVRTRFPPEPNGYLHVGHTKSICLNFGLAREFGGTFNLRFDDTNPAKEEQEYVDSIIRDVKWLGADYDAGPHAGGLYYASDYFEQMYAFACELIEKGRAYVCDLTAEEVSARRGSPKVPATSPFRDRPAAESLRLIEEMKRGAHPDGSRTVRARIDLASPNFNLRDPVMYRIVHKEHHNTGSRWCIYPMYDWAHGLEDSIEGITHSICTLEFEDHRPLYDWFIDSINEGRGPGSRWGEKIHHPQQIEFAKFRPTYTVLSKRNMRKMVEDGVVRGWDDPRFATIAAYRRRGYTPEAFWTLHSDIGVTKFESRIDVGRLEEALRADLNRRAPRRMAVLDPLKVVITNWGDGGDPGRVEAMQAVNNPEDEAAGTRPITFGPEIYIEREDFMEDPPKKFFRLAPGAEVRLRYAYWITCREVIKDGAGKVIELRCTYDPRTRGGDAPPPGPDGVQRKVKGTLHWVNAADCVKAEVRLVDRLFAAEEPGERTGDFLDDLNPDSLRVVRGCKVERALASATPDEPLWADGIRRFQFERLGYFCVDSDSTPTAPVFNRSVGLKDSWTKEASK